MPPFFYLFFVFFLSFFRLFFVFFLCFPRENAKFQEIGNFLTKREKNAKKR